MNYSRLTKAVAPKPQAKAKWYHIVATVIVVIAYVTFVGLGIWLTVGAP